SPLLTNPSSASQIRASEALAVMGSKPGNRPDWDPKRDDRSQRGSTGSVVKVYLCPFYAPPTVRENLPF
ncbi:hypothetical protein, partial [Sphingomonas sp.]|uniref:hypothetical protein n=1 Tax=Sphingomonas sp. TaxID=28214 RepID=UPI00257AB783